MVAPTFQNVQTALTQGGWKSAAQEDGSLRARCPAHKGTNLSLVVSRGEGQKALISCHSKKCTYRDVVAALNLEPPARRTYTSKKPNRPPDFVYEYCDASGAVLTESHRWDKRSGETGAWWTGNNKKICLPFTKGIYKGLKGQECPLFGLLDLLARTDAPVVIVEGEKAVEAARSRLPGAVFLTSNGGSGTASKTDWSPLAGRKVTLWPDADSPGAAYASDVARFVPHLKVVDVTGLPDGWDLADERPADLDVTARLKGAAPIKPRAGGLIAQGKNRRGLTRCFREMGIEARWNLRARCCELFFDDTWHQTEDRLTAHLRAEIGEKFQYETQDGERPLNFGRDLFSDLLDAIVHRRQEDPFLIWVEGLPAWDKTSRIDGLLTEHFGAIDSQLTRWASRYIGVGALQRAYEPGSKLDQVPILIGAQGIGKSAFARGWLPPDQPSWHGDALNLGASDQKQGEAMAGRVVIELSEMAGLRRADIEKLKNFITSTDDGQFRAAYARNPELINRRCVFVGTSNDQDVLPNDPSGNRRFVPVELKTEIGCEFEPLAKANRVQWWAEALHFYKMGVRACLPRDLMADAAEAAEGHRRVDTIEQDVRALIVGDGLKTVTINDLALQLEMPSLPDMPMQKRLADALRSIGWVKRQRSINGTRHRFWCAPEQ